MNKRIIFVLIAFFFSLVIGSAKASGTSNNAEIRDMIVSGCEAICSSSFEASDILKIETLYERFQLKSAQKLVSLMRNRECDRGDSLAIETMEELEDAIKKEYPNSYCAAYTRLMRSIVSHETWFKKELSMMAYEMATELDTENDVQAEELLLVSELIKIASSTNVNGPTEYEHFRRLQCKLNSFYKKHNIHTFLRQNMYGYSSLYLTYMNAYNSYKEHIDHKLRNENIEGYEKVDQNSLSDKMEEEGLQRLSEQHPDYLNIQADACIGRLNEIQDVNKATPLLNAYANYRNRSIQYYGKNHIVPLYLEYNYQWNSKKFIKDYNLNEEEFDSTLDKLLAYSGENAESKIDLMVGAMHLYSITNKNKLKKLFEEVEKLSESLFHHDELVYLVQCQRLLLEHAGLQEYKNSFEALKHFKSELYGDELSWSSITASMSLLQLAQQLFGSTENVIALYDEICEQVNEIAGYDSELAVLYGINYLETKQNSLSQHSATDDIPELIDEYIARADKAKVNVAPFYLIKANNSRTNENTLYFRKALEGNMEYHKGIKENYMPLQINIYGTWLDYMLAVGGKDEYKKECVDFLSPIIKIELFDVKVEHMLMYYSVASYYANTGNYAEAVNIAEKCAQFYRNANFAVDNVYVGFIGLLAGIYANGYADMEKSRQFIGQIREDAERVKPYVSYNDYLNLLRINYDFIEAKSSEDVPLLLANFLPLYESFMEYIGSGNATDDVMWNHMPYFLLKLSNFFSDTQAGVSSASINDVKNGYTNAFTFIEELLERTPTLKNTSNYLQWLMAKARFNELLFKNMDEAEKCYSMIYEKDEKNGSGPYSMFLMRQNKWEAAEKVSRNLLPSFYDNYKKLHENGSTSALSGDASTFFHVYYHIGDYLKAHEFAKLYNEMRTEFINRNFDMFTTQERESYIQQGGAGGHGLYSLLPYLGKKVSPDAYNAVLNEKGLLLRSSERIKQAIENSGNERLIAAYDSIRMLNKRLSSVTDFMDAEKQFAFGQNLDNLKYIGSIREKIEQLERFVSAETANYITSTKVPSWEQVRKSLKKNEVAIEFVDGEYNVTALILRNDFKQPEAVLVLDSASIEHIENYMKEQTSYTENMKKMYDEDGRWLYETIWKPLLPYIGNATHIYYSPTGILNSLSFAAFKFPDESYLIDNYELRQLSTTAKLVDRDMVTHSKKESDAVVIGGLCYEDIQEEYVKEDVEAARKSSEDVVRQREAMESFPFLPYSYIEQENITSTLKNNGVKTTTYTTMTADETTVRNIMKQSPDILHISTHGFSILDYKQAMDIPFFHNQGIPTPLNVAGIALSNANPTWEGNIPPNDKDNILTAEELSTIDLTKTRLVTLSACNTALGASSHEGVMGLQRGLKQAGATTICLSLWSVNDKSSSMLMSNFYNNWLNSQSSMSEAMKEAMKKQRSVTPSPYHWAPFILIDDIE